MSATATSIDLDELARLRRIEEAAKAYVEWANVTTPTEPFASLRAALTDGQDYSDTYVDEDGTIRRIRDDYEPIPQDIREKVEHDIAALTDGQEP